MTKTVTLKESNSIFLDGSGNGTASVQPLSAREVWSPDNAHVQVSTNANEAECQIFVGQSPDNYSYRSGTFSGSSGDSGGSISSSKVYRGDRVWAVWTGGDPRAQATLTVTGTKDV